MNRDRLHIAEPCHASWDGMDKHGASRFCSSCEKSVHDLSAMTERDAADLLQREANLCVRYTCGPDGSLRHKPEATQAMSMLERGLRNGLRIGLGLALVAGGPVLASTAARPSEDSGEPGLIELAVETLKSLIEEAEPIVLMGDVAYEPVELMGELEAEPVVTKTEITVMGGPIGLEVTEVTEDPSQLKPATSHTSYE